MTINPFSQLDTTSRIVKRAQYEALDFELCERGILVRNCSYATPADHEYRVTIKDRIPVACECPADEQYDSACKHRVAVAIRTPLVDATTLRSDGGGSPTTDPEIHAADETPDECDCSDLDGFPCWYCIRTGRRELPESADSL